MWFLDRVRQQLGRGRPREKADASARQNNARPDEEELLPGDYWHVTDASPVNFLFNNVWAGQGWLRSLSDVRRIQGERFITLGDLYPATGEEAETVWERIRAERFPEKPSRRGAIFLFDHRDRPEDAPSTLKGGVAKVVLKARVSSKARIHSGHLGWIASAGNPEENAARYWAGEPCPDGPALRELVVNGNVYFPDWREAPFGPFGSGSGSSGSGPQRSIPVETFVCPACGIQFETSARNSATLFTADRVRCISDPDLTFLFDCPNVAALAEAAWNRLIPPST